MRKSGKSTVAITPGMIALSLAGASAAPAQAQIQFDQPTSYPVPESFSGITVADLNGNALNDIAVCERSETVSIFTNEGNGVFNLLGSMHEPGFELSSIQSVDLDRDGDQDLIWVRRENNHSYSLRVMYNNGRGGVARVNAIPFARVTSALVTEDLDGDGFPDVALLQGNTVQIFKNYSGTLYESAAWNLPWVDSRGIAIGDLDTDGDLDLAVLNMRSTDDSYYGWKVYESEVDVLLNDGTGAFAELRRVPLPYGNNSFTDPFPVSIQVGDLDGDYDLDLVIGASELDDNDAFDVSLLENEGDVTFTTHDIEPFGDSRSYLPVALGDLDTDGDLDIVLTTSLDQTWVLENEGRFSFDSHMLSSSFGSPAAPPVLADMNGDGQIDLTMAGIRTLKVAANSTPYFGPMLEHTPLKRGSQSTLTVQGAVPGERVHFLYSAAHGVGYSQGLQRFGGITMDLNTPIYEAGSVLADANGVAELLLTVPANAPLHDFRLQAAMRRGTEGADSVKTPFRMAVIQP